MQYRNSSYSSGTFNTYWFEKNLQGDIVAVYNEGGTKLVSYTYDAWGNVTTTYHNGGASTAAQYNPFRYRGYYYDSETGLYYVSSRYYDPEIGRWINADSVIAGTGENVLGYNMFAYCFNNPVNMSDPTGNWPSWGTVLKAAAIAVTAVAVVAAVAVTIVTFGGTSIATTIVVSSAITIAANAIEVAMLQGKKSASEGKDAGQVATDIIESVFDNGMGTVAKTAVTKTGGYAIGFYSQSSSFQDVMKLQKMDGYNLKTLAEATTHEIANRFTNLKCCVSATASTGSMLIYYGFAGLNVVNTVISIFADDPVQRATSRGYTLK
jgi:RHS repeat-associated protein